MLHVCLFVSLQCLGNERKGLQLSWSWVYTGSCALPNVAARNHTLVLSLNCWAISPDPKLVFLSITVQWVILCFMYLNQQSKICNSSCFTPSDFDRVALCRFYSLCSASYTVYTRHVTVNHVSLCWVKHGNFHLHLFAVTSKYHILKPQRWC